MGEDELMQLGQQRLPDSLGSGRLPYQTGQATARYITPPATARYITPPGDVSYPASPIRPIPGRYRAGPGAIGGDTVSGLNGLYGRPQGYSAPQIGDVGATPGRTMLADSAGRIYSSPRLPSTLRWEPASLGGPGIPMVRPNSLPVPGQVIPPEIDIGTGAPFGRTGWEAQGMGSPRATPRGPMSSGVGSPQPQLTYQAPRQNFGYDFMGPRQPRGGASSQQGAAWNANRMGPPAPAAVNDPFAVAPPKAPGAGIGGVLNGVGVGQALMPWAQQLATGDPMSEKLVSDLGRGSMPNAIGSALDWATENIGGPVARAFGYQEHPGVPPNPIADEAHPGQWRSMTDAELGKRASMDSAARQKMPGGTLDYGGAQNKSGWKIIGEDQRQQTTAPTGLGSQFDELYASALPMIRRKIEDGIDLTPSEQMIFTAAHNYHANSLAANQSVPHGNGMKPHSPLDFMNAYKELYATNPDLVSENVLDDKKQPQKDKDGNPIRRVIPIEAWVRLQALDEAKHMSDFGGEGGPALGGAPSGAGNFKMLGMPHGGSQPQGQQMALGAQNQQSAEDAAYDRIDAANANSQAAADAHGANTYAAKKREYQARIAAAKTHKEKQRLMEAMQKELGTGGSEMMDVNQISQIDENRKRLLGGRG